MQLGTLSGNPVAAVAGLKTMEILARPGTYETLRASGERLQQMQSRALSTAGIAHRVVGDPTLFDIVFTEGQVRDYRGTKAADHALNARYNAGLRAHSVFKSPGKLYPCLALTEADFELTEAAVNAAIAEL